MNLTGNVSNLSIGNIVVKSTTSGQIDVDVVKNFLNYAFTVCTPLFNQWIATKYIAIPNTLLGLFELSDLNLAYFDHYI
jgi:hypothetical protein